MKIAVNTRLLLKDRLEGIGWFGHETLSRITRAHPDVEFHFFFDREFDQEFIYGDNVKGHILHPQARHPFLYYFWFEWVVKAKLEKIKPDLFLSIDGLLSMRSSCKQLAVIHDINFEHYPAYLPFMTRMYYRYYFKRFAKKAMRIATVSEYSKKDIQNIYGISEETIDVVYNGANETFKPISIDQKSKVQSQYSEGHDYLIYVGAIQPRKNITRLMQAFDQFKKDSPSDLRLLLTGKKKWWNIEQGRLYESLEFKEHILFTGRLPQEALVQVLAGSEGLCYVSTYEGFGIPILEAMCCDVPVLTSNTSAMPEIGGDAPVYCDPLSIVSIKEGMKDLLDPSLREKRLAEGAEQRSRFSWDRTAEKLWESIEKAI